jgi:hypothetical protein
MIKLNRNFTVASTDTGPTLVSNLKPATQKRLEITAGVQAQADKLRKHNVEAWDQTQQGGRTSIGQTQTSSNVSRATLENIFVEDPRIKRKIFRDMYYHDPVCGGAADVYANLPFSDFHLSGIKDKDILEKFHQSLEGLHLRALLPGISLDYQVLGAFIGNAIFEQDEKVFTAVLPQSIDNTEIVNIPLFGVDPIIDLIMPKDLSKIMQSNDPRVAQVMSHIPQEFIEKIKQGRIPLEPANTIYIPRRTMTAEPFGVSMYERVLPVHLIEKALMRGTIDVANRRQRALLHVMVGGDDEWIPTQSDLESFRDLFLQGDLDPTGAIIVTRTGVNTNEIRAAGEFWNVDQVFEYASANKYRAFGLSEGILTGEVSLSTLDASLSVMLDNIRTFRAKITTGLFYEKLFPAISAANDFREERRYQVTGSSGPRIETDDERIYRIANRRLYNDVIPRHRHKTIAGVDMDTHDLLIPKVVYHKHLSPEGDQAYLQMLNDMNGMGIPVPIAMLAAAGSLDINQIVANFQEDLAMRKKIAMYNAQIDEMTQQLQQQSQQEAGGDDQSQQFVGSALKSMSRFGVGANMSLHRDYDPSVDTGAFGEGGKRINISAKGQKVIKEKTMKTIAKALADRRARALALRKANKVVKTLVEVGKR